MVAHVSSPFAWALAAFIFTSRTLAADPVYIGCYSSSDGLTENSTYKWQSSGYCQGLCLQDNNQAILGLTSGNNCYCGNQLPATSDKVSDDQCNSPCTGYGTDSCGGSSYWSVYTTGNGADISSVDGTSGPGPASGGQSNSNKGVASTARSSPSVVTSISPGKTVVVTQTPEAASDNTTNTTTKSGGSKTGVVVGVIIGVIALLVISVGLWFFLVRRRKQQDAESSAAATSGAAMAETNKEYKIPSTSRFTQYNRPGGGDARLDSVTDNRASSYSLDDSADYSRKILTVANPDR